MGSYDPTSPKVDDGFIASDGENDVQGHVYKNGDDVPTELRADQVSGDGFAPMVDQEEDVEGHLRVLAEGGDEGFRAAAAPEDSGDGFRAAADQEDDVEGHLGAGLESGFAARADQGDGIRAYAVPDEENDGGPEGFKSL